MSNDPGARAARLEQFLARDPDNTILMTDLARHLHEAGNHQRASELLGEVMRRNGESAELLGALANAQLAIGHWAEAAASLKKAVEREPDSANLRFNLGYAQLAAESPEAAAASFSAAIAVDAANARFHYYLALACDAQGDAAASRGALNRALALDPQLHDAQLLSAYAALEDGNLSQGRAIAEQLTGCHPHSALAWQMQGQIALLEFDAKNAVRHFKQALAIDSDNADSKEWLAQALLMLGRTQQAQTVLQEALKLAPEKASLHVASGWFRVLEQDVANARAAFARALACDPAEAEAHAGMALIYLAENDVVAAENAADHSLRLNPDGIAATALKARIAELRQYPDQAQAIIQRMLQAPPAGPFGRNNVELFEKAKSSAAVRRITNKFARLEKKHGRRR
jgi:tetratricopeptide (TPR) repeat protein